MKGIFEEHYFLSQFQCKKYHFLNTYFHGGLKGNLFYHEGNSHDKHGIEHIVLDQNGKRNLYLWKANNSYLYKKIHHVGTNRFSLLTHTFEFSQYLIQ